MAKKDCPYCGGKQKFSIAGTNIELACEYCVKGVIPKLTESEPGLLSRLATFFNGE